MNHERPQTLNHLRKMTIIKVHGAVPVPKDSFKELVQTIVLMRMNVHFQIHVIQLQLVQTQKVPLNVHVPLVIQVMVLPALMMMNASILLPVVVIQMHFASITEIVQILIQYDSYYMSHIFFRL